MIAALLATLAPAAVEGSNPLLKIAGDFGVKPHLLLAQIINFALVAWILYSLVLLPILRQLDSRAAKIAEGLAQAEAAQATLAAAKAQHDQTLLEARREATQIIEAAQKEADAHAAKQRAHAQREAEEMLHSARRQTALEQEQQILASQARIAQTVVALAEKNLGEDLTPDQRQRYAERATHSLSAQ
jgi:F-type H+-transporting ATPase subunit b